MIYITHYSSPIGNILLAAKNHQLIGLWIENQKYYLGNFQEELKEDHQYDIFIKTKKWLDRYFEGKKPKISELNMQLIGSDFRKEVWQLLTEIPYGKTITYRELAKRIAKKRGINNMSAQAVGGAVAHNPISIIIPCHRVVGENGSLTGYAGGIEKKMDLLKHEGADLHNLFVPGKEVRCKWVNLRNPLYVHYHDYEWGIPHYDDAYLYELLLLESFQAGLSWECILNKREAFREAFDSFDYQKIAFYDARKIEELYHNPAIIRNKLKIHAAVTNAKVFLKIQKEFGSFSNYIWQFSNYQVVKNKDDNFRTTSPLSDKVSKDLKNRGMKFVGSTIIYSYLQAIGMINDHELACDFYQRGEK